MRAPRINMSENQYALMRYFVDNADTMNLADWCVALERAYDLGRFEAEDDGRVTLTDLPVLPL
jgi:hypothetical protein